MKTLARYTVPFWHAMLACFIEAGFGIWLGYLIWGR
jgi:hypothetical protein